MINLYTQLGSRDPSQTTGHLIPTYTARSYNGEECGLTYDRSISRKTKKKLVTTHVFSIFLNGAWILKRLGTGLGKIEELITKRHLYQSTLHNTESISKYRANTGNFSTEKSGKFFSPRPRDRSRDSKRPTTTTPLVSHILILK